MFDDVTPNGMEMENFFQDDDGGMNNGRSSHEELLLSLSGANDNEKVDREGYDPEGEDPFAHELTHQEGLDIIDDFYPDSPQLEPEHHAQPIAEVESGQNNDTNDTGESQEDEEETQDKQIEGEHNSATLPAPLGSIPPPQAPVWTGSTPVSVAAVEPRFSSLYVSEPARLHGIRSLASGYDRHRGPLQHLRDSKRRP